VDSVSPHPKKLKKKLKSRLYSVYYEVESASSSVSDVDNHVVIRMLQHTVTCRGTWPFLTAKCDVFCHWRRQMWRTRVLETPFGFFHRFIYDFTSRHYNFFYSVTRTRLTASSLPCWFLILVGPLIAGFLIAALSDPLISSEVASLISSFDLPGFYSLPPWNRVLAPRIGDALSKGNFSAVGQVVTGITSVNIRCLGIATIRSLFVVAGALTEPLLSKCSHLS
jgi:hypothetical protein